MRQKTGPFRAVPVVLSATIAVAVIPESHFTTEPSSTVNSRIENIRAQVRDGKGGVLKRAVDTDGELLIRQAQFDKAFGNCFRNASSGSGNKC